MNTLTKNIIAISLPVAIVVAAIALPKIAGASELKEEVRCTIRQKNCIVITDRQLSIALVSLFTREICPGAKPDVVRMEKNGHTSWHSRYECNSGLRQTIFTRVNYIKQ